MSEVGKKTSKFDRDADDWYVEPSWTVELLLKAIRFHGSIWDPACGMGTIPKACIEAGHESVTGTDLVDRGYGTGGQNFLKFNAGYVQPADNIITNPPYKHSEQFIRQAGKFTRDKAAFLVPVKFLNSNARYGLFTELPIWRVCILSSRPSMLPGERLMAGEKPGGGAIDYCWIVFKRGYEGTAGVVWLKRADSRSKPYSGQRGHKSAPEAALSRQEGAS